MKLFSTILSLCLAGMVYFAHRQNQEINSLRSELEILQQNAETAAIAEEKEQTPKMDVTIASVPAVEPAATPTEETESQQPKRIMRDFSQMMDNPQVNEMMEASQRATLEVMYKDLLDEFDFTPDERIHFMDLLMARQMFRVETSMKMMGGSSSSEEMKILGEEMKEYDEQVKSEITTFLNNENDAGEFEFFEKTLGERMSLSGFKTSMSTAGKPITREMERSLLEIMADQKSSFDFSSDLADETDYNMGAERFSSENIENFETDLQELHNIIAEESQDLLDPEQLAALVQSLESMRNMQLSQLRMAANMFAPKPQE